MNKLTLLRLFQPRPSGLSNCVVKFLNAMQSGSLYNEGMRPLLYSELDAATKKIGWIRTGDNIKYYKNAIRSGSCS